MKKSDLSELSQLLNCEIIRHTLKEDILELLVVGDNEEDEVHDHHDDEDGDDCCDGLNGHLFLLVFLKVKNLKIAGNESDNYKTIKVENSEHHLYIELEGYNFLADDEKVEIEFDFDSYQVIDKGEIKGPDA